MTVLDMGIDTLFDEEWFTGAPSASAVDIPGLYQVAINGRGYVIDPAGYSRVTVPLRRESTDESVEPGEQTLNTGGAWRRSQDNWFLGAGQEFLDNRFAFVSVYTHSGEDPSVRTRFWRSKGVNPWAEGALSLLPEYHQDSTTLSSNATGKQCMKTVGSYTYWSFPSGGSWYVSQRDNDLSINVSITAPTSWGMTGTQWPQPTSMTTDGDNLYIACGAYGVAVLASGTSTATALRPTATAPTVTPTGGIGTTYNYYVVAIDANGYKSLPSPVGTTAVGPAALDATHFNLVTWAPVSGAVKYDLLVGTTGTSIGTNITGTSFTDDGAHGSLTPVAYTPPTANTQNFNATFVIYANSFLLGGAANSLCSLAANGITTTVLSHSNSHFVWECGSDAPGNIYVSGSGSGKSELYGIQLSTTTFTLGSPYIAGSVTAGETINDLLYYQGLVILATSLGIRTAQASGTNGYLTMGPVITNLGPSLCLAVHGAFCYFGVSNYAENDGVWQGSTTTSGLGRLSLSVFSSALIPAFATDVMSTTTGNVTAVEINTDGNPFFTVEASGLWWPSGNVVPQGWLESGWVRYGTIEDKILVSTNIRHDALQGEVDIEVVPFAQPNASRTVLTSTAQGSTQPLYYASSGNLRSEAYMVIPILKRSSTDPTKGPVLRRWTTRSVVTALRQDQIVVPIMWRDEILNPQGDGTAIHMDLEGEWDFLKGLEASGEIFVYQEGAKTCTCFVDQIETKALQWNDQRRMLEGILSVKLLTVA